MAGTVIFKPFSTLVTIGTNSCLCDSCSVNEGVSLLESGAGYGGSITGQDSRFNSNSMMDYGELSGSVGVTYTQAFLSAMQAWTLVRNTSKNVNVSGAGIFSFGECYWTSLSFAASMDANLTGDISFYVKEKTLQQGSLNSYAGSGGGPTELKGEVCIPYWKTTVTGAGNNVLSWTLTFGQEIKKKFFLRGLQTDTPQDPSYLICGNSTCELNVSLLGIDIDVSQYNKRYGALALSVLAGPSTTFNFTEGAVSAAAPTVIGDYTNLEVTYKLMNHTT